eukprot:1191980-Prorocentrum_minimum.AAC.2
MTARTQFQHGSHAQTAAISVRMGLRPLGPSACPSITLRLTTAVPCDCRYSKRVGLGYRVSSILIT